MELRHPALEHGTTRSGRWLRENRVRIALVVALVEGLLVLFDAIAGWAALLVGAIVVGFYFAVGRNLRAGLLRDASWTAALSQLLVALVAVAAFVFSLLALLALAVVAVAGLFLLLRDRR